MHYMQEENKVIWRLARGSFLEALVLMGIGVVDNPRVGFVKFLWGLCGIFVVIACISIGAYIIGYLE